MMCDEDCGRVVEKDYNTTCDECLKEVANMSKGSGEYRCGCDSTDIRSIEIITMAFPVYPNEDNEPEFDGTNGKTLCSDIDSIKCMVCNAEYALDELHTIIVESEDK